MWIVELEANPNGSHNDHNADHITSVPEGCAMIPEDFTVPPSFPFVDIEAEEITHYRTIEVEKEVTKTRETGFTDEDGNPITETYTEMETVTEERPWTAMTVISMTEKVVPVVEEPVTVTQLDRVEAQATYTAMMTDTLLEV